MFPGCLSALHEEAHVTGKERGLGHARGEGNFGKRAKEGSVDAAP